MWCLLSSLWPLDTGSFTNTGGKTALNNFVFLTPILLSVWLLRSRSSYCTSCATFFGGYVLVFVISAFAISNFVTTFNDSNRANVTVLPLAKCSICKAFHGMLALHIF